MPVVRNYTAILSNHSIHDTSGKAAFYTYSFPSAVPSYYYDAEYGDELPAEGLATFRPLTTAQKDAIRSALDAWASVSGLTFFEVPSDHGDMVFGVYDLRKLGQGGSAGYAYYPDGKFSSPIDSDVFLYPDYASNRKTLLHEIGHAIGLKHSFSGDVTLADDMDHYGSTVMSYTSGGFSGNKLGSLDLDAVVHLYGPASADGTQVTSWSWNTATYTLTQTGSAAAETIFGVGGTDIIHGLDGADFIVGRGGDDHLDGGGGDDELHGGVGNDRLFGGLGKDRLDGEGGDDRLDGGDGDDTLSAGAGTDILFGAAGADSLFAGHGDDWLFGGGGADHLYGDAGSDTFVYTRASDSTTDQQDHIGQFESGIDKIDVSALDMPVVSWTPGTYSSGGTYSIVRIETANGTLSIFIDGVVASGDFVTTRAPVLGTSGNDSLQGTVVADLLRGLAGNDSLSGLDGDDSLDGGAGSDSLRGGPGDDVYHVDDPGDVIIELAGEGTDRVFTSISYSLGAGVHAETLSASDAAATADLVLAGNELDNHIIGNAGQNTLYGMAGNDRLDGLGGNDSYVVDSAADTVIEHEGHGQDSVFASVSYTLAAGVSIEVMATMDSAGTHAIDLIGNDLAQSIYGNAGPNLLIGGGGDDYIFGGAGADRMYGGTGDDVYYIDDAGDRVFEAAGEGIDTVWTTLATSSLFGTHVEILRAASDIARDFRGSALSNLLTGGAGNDILRLQDGGGDGAYGGEGNDISFFGGALDEWDRVDGGPGFDTLVLQGNYINFVLGSAVLSGIEGISLQSGSVTRWGQSGASSYDYAIALPSALIAPGQQFRINGQSLQPNEDLAIDASAETDGGRLLIYGGFGADVLTSGSGNDIFFFEAGRLGTGDRIAGAGGNDAVVVSGAPAGTAGPARVTIAAGMLSSVESLSFNGRFASDPSARPSYDVTIEHGNLAGGATLIVNASSLGPEQSLFFSGWAVGDGKFRIFGGAGGDSLKGGAGDDVIEGGGLGDFLAGGYGKDVFVYRNLSDSGGSAPDVISDFHFGNDRIDLSLLDANAVAAGDQAFAWIAGNAFSRTPGELRVVFDAGMNMWALLADVNGDTIADFRLLVSTGAGPPPVSDIIL